MAEKQGLTSSPPGTAHPPQPSLDKGGNKGEAQSPPFKNLSDIELLTLCIYGEARNQGLDGILAVASVVINRVKSPTWWGSDIKGVILKDKQFSCFNEADPNHHILKNAALDFQGSLRRLRVFRSCQWIARGAIEGHLSSNVGGATHYHEKSINPSWAGKLIKIKQVGDHIFYV